LRQKIQKTFARVRTRAQRAHVGEIEAHSAKRAHLALVMHF